MIAGKSKSTAKPGSRSLRKQGCAAATEKDLLVFDVKHFKIHKDIFSKEKLRRTSAEKDFWEECGDYAMKSGCYVIAKKASHGILPVYVGKATKTFRKEVFNSGNILKCIEGFEGAIKYNIIIFFIVHPKQKGKINAKFIDQIETYLIGLGVEANKKIVNSKKRGEQYWAIKGVVRHGKGKFSESARKFRTCMNIS